MGIDELMEWIRETKTATLDASKREITVLWNTQLGRIDAAIANPETTPASFKAVVDSCEEFNVAVDAEHKRFFVFRESASPSVPSEARRGLRRLA